MTEEKPKSSAGLFIPALTGLAGIAIGFLFAPTINYWGLVLKHGPILTKISEKCTEEVKFKEIWIGPPYQPIKKRQ